MEYCLQPRQSLSFHRYRLLYSQIKMSPIIPSRYGHPKYNIPYKSRADSKSRKKQKVEEGKLTVQPTEIEDGDNFFNQEQTSDHVKLQALKKRVKSLTEYQKKIDDEIKELNEKFNTKKAKIVSDGNKFTEKLSGFIANSKIELEARAVLSRLVNEVASSVQV